MRFLTGLLAIGLGTAALAADIKLTGENTKVEFTGKKKDGKHDGGFKKLSGTASVTGSDPTTIKVEVTIETDSLWSDNEKLTAHLKNPDFFDVKTNPQAKFTSTKVEKADGGKYKVTGELALNGKKKEISFPAEITADGGTLKVNSEFQIKRMDFGMSYMPDRIDNEVTIRLKVDAK
jgi:polyisoprenoid-binding protein YceI